MKNFILLLVVSCIIFSCNSDSTTNVVKTDSVAVSEPLVYPFTPKYSLKWEKGDEKNALVVLNCLKNYLGNDMKAAAADFADTVEFIADKFHFKGSKDSLTAMLVAMRSKYASINKVFDTWITTYYPETKDTWVTLWYTEIWTDKKGKTDSLYYTDDVLFRNGKITVYDEKIRQFPVAKTK